MSQLRVTRLAARTYKRNPHYNALANFRPNFWKYVNIMEHMPGRDHNSKLEKQRRDRRKGRDDDPRVLLSKSMASVLRHNADKFGLKMRPDGYARVDDMLALPKFRGQNLEAIRAVVDADDKNRYNLKQETDSSGLTAWWVRANQGHSMQTVTIEMRELVDPASIPMAVHGTTRAAWESIAKQGLSRMARQHIHFAQGLANDDGVISGMRKTSAVLVFINVAKAMESGIKFFISENGVVLTPGNAQGFLPPQFFSRVENAKTGNPIDGISGPRQPIPLATTKPASLESAGKKVEGTEKVKDDDEEDAEAAWAAIAAKTASIELKDKTTA